MKVIYYTSDEFDLLQKTFTEGHPWYETNTAYHSLLTKVKHTLESCNDDELVLYINQCAEFYDPEMTQDECQIHIYDLCKRAAAAATIDKHWNIIYLAYPECWRLGSDDWEKNRQMTLRYALRPIITNAMLINMKALDHTLQVLNQEAEVIGDIYWLQNTKYHKAFHAFMCDPPLFVGQDTEK